MIVRDINGVIKFPEIPFSVQHDFLIRNSTGGFGILEKIPPNYLFLKKTDKKTPFPVKNITGNILFYIEIDREKVAKKEKEEKIKNIILIYQTKMNKLTEKYTTEEQKTWNIQEQEAELYLADNTAKVPMLREIADGEDIATLAQRILAKAHFLKVESGKLLAWKNRELKKIEDEY